MSPTASVDEKKGLESPEVPTLEKVTYLEDAAAKFLRDVDVESIAAKATDETYRALVRKLDRRLLPILFITYALQCIDKSCLGYASVFTLISDLGLHGKQYNLLSSCFYIGYLAFEYPTTLLSQKFPIGRFIGLAIVIWGGILMATAGAHNFAGMAVLRIALGAFESLITPTFILINGMYYTRTEQVLRTGAWACANGFGSMIGGIIAFGMGQIDNTSLPSWKYIFIMNGALTMCWGVYVYFFLPTSPMAATGFLTVEERALAIYRIRGNKTGILNRTLKWNQVREALNPLEDPQGILLFLFIFCNEVLNGGFGAFGGLVIKAMGFSSLQSTLIYIPQGFINMICILFGGWLAQRFPNFRLWTCILMLIPTFIGLLLQIVLAEDNVAGKLVGVYLFPPFATSLFVGLSLPGVNASGYSKRMTLASLAFAGYALGNIAGPFMLKTGEHPAYHTGFTTDIICIVIQGILLFALRMYYVTCNKRRDAAKVAGEKQSIDETAYWDLTDKDPRMQGFRYVY
ncbi:major facilitator superfamily domain-containing protein [Mycena latifolia]|nr:major facilitator superfamily domain-containing protein [Mycena latifolia]